MNSFIKSYWKTLLFFGVVGLFGGFCTGLYLLDSFPDDMKQQLMAELAGAGLGGLPVTLATGLVNAVQGAVYGIVLGAIGIAIAKELRLWKDERTIGAKALGAAILVGVIGGLLMILPDMFVFGKYSDAVMNSYAAKPSLVYILGAVTYGAVIEEIMLRLFAMSLVALILHRLFGKGVGRPRDSVLIIANIVSAILFAALHLPTTGMLLGFTPLLIFRCFLLNGGLGLLFGRLYRKYGLRYAMIAHGGCHVVSKVIWLLFI